MKKYVNKVEDLLAQAMNPTTKAYEEIDNLMEFTLPDMEPNSEEISGYAGMTGAIELTDWGNMGAPELSIKLSTLPANGKNILRPKGTSLKLNWAESVVNDAGEVSYQSYAVYASGMPKVLPGGTKKKGERPECEIKIACNKYKMIKDGVEVINYDPMNGKTAVYGENYATAMKNALTAY